MKTLKILLASTLLMASSAMAMTAKMKDGEKTVYKVLEGTTTDKELKPGLPIDLTYKSQHVEVGQASDVNVTLTTKLSSGTLKVEIKALNEHLIGIEENEVEFELSKEQTSYPINLQVGSALDGIHYINFIMSMEGGESRVLAVPVNIGTVSNKVSNKSVESTKEGTNITVSSAKEEIK